MMKLPEGFDFSGVYCYRGKDDPSTFFFLPGEPGPEKDTLGRPTLTLWVSNQGAILQLGVWWQVEPDLLIALKKYIAEQFKLEPAIIRLSPVPVAIQGVTLALGDGAGKFEPLQTTLSSGYPPFAAIFYVQLTADQKTQAVAALNGREGFLTVTYRGSVSTEVTVEIAIEGDVQAEVVALGPNAAFAEALARIESGLAEGRLLLRQSGSPEVPEELRQKAERMAKLKAATVLQRMARGLTAPPDTSRLKVTVSLNEQMTLPIERVTDVSSWFSIGGGADHIRVLPTAIPDLPEPPAVTEMVRLGFDAKEAPIAFVQVARGEAKAILRGPNFEPVTLSVAEPEKPLVVKTNYTDGGPPYDAVQFTAGLEGWSLSPENLGLVRVVVDGTAIRDAGAKEARIHLRYQPSGKGAGDDRTIYFRRNEWIAGWYLVTRSAGLGGALEYEWKETTTKGTTVKHSFVTTDNPEIKL